MPAPSSRDLHILAEALATVCAGLSPDAAGRHRSALAEHIVQTALKLPQPGHKDADLRHLKILAGALASACKGLAPDQASRHAEAFARYILTRRRKPGRPSTCRISPLSLQAIKEHIPAGASGSHPAETLAEILFTIWDDTPAGLMVSTSLVEAIQTVSATLPAAAARRFADRALDTMKGGQSASAMRDRAVVVQSLLERLPDSEAAPRRVAAVLVAIRLEARTNRGARVLKYGPPSLLAQLDPLVPACAASDLVDLLRSPAATGAMQAWILGELSRRCRHEFRSVWDVVDWYERNQTPLDTRKPLPLIGGAEPR